MDKTYSIIIPHKNIVPLLKRCLESIPNRNDIQVVVVDDHSDVKNIQQIEQLCITNHADLVKTQESKGAGYVRNIGLKYASGKWVLFADADDFFHSEAFQELDKFVNSSYDVVYFYCDSKNSDSLKPDKDRVPAIKDGILNKDYDLLRYKSSVPWGNLISMNLIREHGLKFEEVIASNDIMFSVTTGYAAKNIACISKPLYCVTTRSGSLYAKPTPERMKSRFYASIRVNSFLKTINKLEYRNEPLRDLFYFLPTDLTFFVKGLYLCKKQESWTNFLLHLSDTVSLNFKIFIKRKGLWKK